MKNPPAPHVNFCVYRRVCVFALVRVCVCVCEFATRPHACCKRRPPDDLFFVRGCTSIYRWCTSIYRCCTSFIDAVHLFIDVLHLFIDVLQLLIEVVNLFGHWALRFLLFLAAQKIARRRFSDECRRASDTPPRIYLWM